MRRMGIGLGVGINRSNYAQGIFGAYATRVVADGGVVEAGACVDAVSGLLLTASLLLIPSGYKSTKLYSEIPTNGNGDLTWARTSTANRTNSSGLLESMATGVPRLDYTYGSCPAVLLEPQRTNLALQSETFDNASWTKSASSITANSTISPSGLTDADSLIENTANSSHQVFQTITSVNGANAYTATIYIKQNTNRNAAIRVQDGAFTYGQAVVTYNLNTGALISQNVSGNGAILSTSATLVSGYYRIQLTFTINLSTSFRYDVLIVNGTSNSYTGDGTSGIVIYGAQLEAGAYPTTYIQTTSATATRVADSFSRNNIYTNGLITSSGGTWFVELRNNVAYTRDTFTIGLYISDTTNISSNNINIRTGGGTARLTINKVIAGVSTFLYLTTTDTTKLAIKWNGTTADIFANGTKVISATAFTTTNMEFLRGDTTQVPVFIQQMALYPSPLSDTDCTTLTTL